MARTCYNNCYSRGRSTERGTGPPSRDPSTSSTNSANHFQLQPLPQLGQANVVQPADGGGRGQLDSFSSNNQLYYTAEGEAIQHPQQQGTVPWGNRSIAEAGGTGNMSSVRCEYLGGMEKEEEGRDEDGRE